MIKNANSTNKYKWGYLRETEEQAQKAGASDITGMHRTGLETYLKVIFPNTNDWIHNKTVPNCIKNTRPDYRSESLKLIIEFNGIDHYTKPDVIFKDIEKEKMYKDMGYKVVQIPFFIQLTNQAVKKMFGVVIEEQLFDGNVPSLLVDDSCTPAFLCPLGIKRMAEDFLNYPEQYENNMQSMKNEDLQLTSWDLLEKEYKNLKNEECEICQK